MEADSIELVRRETFPFQGMMKGKLSGGRVEMSFWAGREWRSYART
jgi:hypothetical protein